MLHAETRGSFNNTMNFLNRMKRRDQFRVLHKYGPMGVTALQGATPKDSAFTAESWYYEIVDKPGYFSITWYNRHVEDPRRQNIAILLQYGHATRTGGYVQGIDYINPALKPIFDQMLADMWKEVTK